ncbi:hypothetical protein Glove_109g262 [Diversispora epigaea]|uniref:Uncharacterized protein n=1 Tax=Diversispora epigaea TaxID=1348612 RepID=A0A397J279_9GLOM|nr:hypothetical protein Glove_109g262 [Diversispora epigaea]
MHKKPNKAYSFEEVWIRPVLSLRIIYPNGTVSEIDKDLEIQEFNWHLTRGLAGIQDPVKIFSLQKGYLLVTYYNASNPDDINTYEEWGRIIDWNGVLYDEVFFGKAYIIDGIWYPSATGIVTNVDPEKGFIRIVGMNVTYIEWQQYMIGDSFNLKKLSEGNITIPQSGNSALFNIIPTVDEGYSLIMGNSTTDSSNNNTLEIRTAVYALTKGYNDKQFSAPKMIYQLSLDNITITNLFAGTSSTGIGQVCALIVSQNVANVSKTYYVRLNFLSTGSITEIVPLGLNVPELPSNSNSSGWVLDIIPYGGFAFSDRFYDANDQYNVCMYYFNDFTNNFTLWDYGESEVLDKRGVFIILPNNTMLVSKLDDFNAWSFNITDIPKFTDLNDDYLNFQVNSTSPSIDAIISTSTKNITITYHEPVELSNGNISIYQIDNSGNNIIRQFFKGVNSFCSISDDGLTVTVNVIKCTFIVRSKAYRESIMGIYDNIWKFNTSSSKETFADTVSGVLRLTVEGTEYYENLDTTRKDQFFADLHLELSKILPVNIKRLSSNGKTQVDTTIPSRQILISLNIESSKDERSVASIVGDLNDMIIYKNMTSVGLYPTTKYLDGDFGFKPKPNFWDEYRWKILGVILALAILVILFLIAKKMESKGRDLAILQLGLIIFDFIMDVLFVSKNGKVIEVLYIPSDENKSKTFLDWFSQHEKVASVFTVLSSADIETLSILYSNLAGFKFFQAPISTKGKNRIFWASFLTLFVEDIPQLIIQLLYHYSVVAYDIIPLLALVSSCLSLLINIIGRLFQAINSCRPRTLEHDSEPNLDGFDNFQQLQSPVTERNSTSERSISHSIDVKEKK